MLLLIDLKPEQDERCRLRTNVFPVETQFIRSQIKGGDRGAVPSESRGHET